MLEVSQPLLATVTFAYTQGTFGVKLFKMVHCRIKNNMTAALSRFLVDGYPLIVAAWKSCFSKYRQKELNVSDEQTVSAGEFQVVRAAAQNEPEPKVRFVRGSFRRLAEEDDLRTLEGQQ